jgi:hypothetical protein
MMMQKLGRLIVVTAILISGVDCRSLAPKGAAYARQFVIVPGATDITFTNDNDGGVWYWVADSYPGIRTLDTISDDLRSRGWTPVREDPLNPGQISSHERGWARFSLETGQVVHQWLGGWRDPGGNIMVYSLEYRAARGGSPPPVVEVRAAFLLSETVAALRKKRD